MLGWAIAFNPAWPPPADTPAAALADPALQPDDPEFRLDVACSGQHELFGFVPSCGALEEAPGARVDVAWLRTRGLPTVTIAHVGDGLDLSLEALSSRILLSPGELTGTLDRNGDGVITLLDFVSSTATEAASLDRIVDARLLARGDLGDVNGNGRLDVVDLVTVFSDGVDDDGNGLVDDIAGWDFLIGAALPDLAESPETALAAVAPANDGLGGVGACPSCTLLPIRVGASGAALPDRLAYGLAYAKARGPQIAAVPSAVPGLTPAVEAAAEGLLVVVGDGHRERRGRLDDVPLEGPGVLRVSAVGYAEDPATATDAAAPLARFGGSVGTDVSVGGFVEQGSAIGVAAGVAGLAWSVSSSVAPSALAAAIVASARPTEETGPQTGARTTRLGSGRLDAAALLEQLSSQEAVALSWSAPAARALVDPTAGTLSIAADTASDVAWTLSVGTGLEPTSFEALASGTTDAGEIRASVDVSGWLDDPIAAPRELEASVRVLRLVLGPEDAPLAARDRTIFLGADVRTLPGFPVALGAGAVSSPRFGDLDGDGVAELWVSLLDGRVVTVSRAGEVLETSPGRASSLPSAAWAPETSAPVLAAPTFWNASPLGIAWVDVERVLSVKSGSALEGVERIGAPEFPSTTLPLGSVSGPMSAAAEDGVEALWWLRTEGLWRYDGVSTTHLLADPPSALAWGALDAEAGPWTLSGSALFFDAAIIANGPEPLSPEGFLRLRPPQPALGDDGEGRRGIFWITATGGAGLTDDGLESTTTLVAPASGALSMGPDGPVGWAWTSAGRLLPSGGLASRGLPEDFSGTGAELAIGDVDGGDVEWVMGDDTARLRAVSVNGAEAVGFPKLVGRPVVGAPALGDLDGDGVVEVAVVTRDGRLFAFRTGGALEKTSWGGDRHDASGSADASRAFEQISAEESGGCRCVAFGARFTPLWALLGLASLLRRRARK